jgi:hypothetical protein
MMHLPDLPEIEAAAQVVYRHFQATPQYRWALLSERLGTDCWVKHENHTPVGAFKIRGGLTYFEQLAQTGALPREVISATRGNHGQSVGWAARAHGVACTIVVPHGNSVEKNAAMRALGVTLIEHGDDFQESREHAHAPGDHTRGAHGAEFSPGPDQRRQHLLVGILQGRAAARRGLRADRPGLGRVRGDCRQAGAGPPGAHRRRGEQRWPPPTPTRWQPGAWWKPRSARCWPTAWRCASPMPMRWPC